MTSPNSIRKGSWTRYSVQANSGGVPLMLSCGSSARPATLLENSLQRHALRPEWGRIETSEETHVSGEIDGHNA